MNRPIFFLTLLASMLVLAVSPPATAEVNPASLAERDMAAQSRGDVTAALALYGDDAIVQYGGLCWTPCVGKTAIQKELERGSRPKTSGRSSANTCPATSRWFRPSSGLAISKNPAWTESSYGAFTR
jgi:hypothetical protein